MKNKYPQEIKDEIINFIKEMPRNFSRTIERRKPQLYKYIIENTPKNLRMSTRIYWILNDIFDYPVCELCGKQFTHSIQFNKGYPRYCKNCNNSIESDRTKNARQTNIKRFGCISNFGNKENHQKGTQTLIEHYGVDHNWKAKEVRQTCKETCKKTYGDENYNNREKVRHTCAEKYGDPYYHNKEKACKTFYKHKEENPSFISDIQQKIKNTKKERYGNENYSNLEKTKNTLIKKYGISCPPHWKYIYNEISFDSSYEVAYYIWLTDHNIEFQYPCPITFNYIDDKGKEHTYYPDFLVEGKVVEIKGIHFFKDHDPTKELISPYGDNSNLCLAKYNCMIENNVLILSNKECNKFLDYVSTVYGKNYIQDHKCK